MKNEKENTIIVGHDKRKEVIDKEKINFSWENETLHIQIKKDSTLKIEVELEKLFLNLEVKENVKANLILFKKGKNSFYQEQYIVGKNSILNLNKICFLDGSREMVSAYLEGENAKINYVCKTIANKEEKYEIDIFHHANHTECILYNHGITYKMGKISFLVSNRVPKGILHTKINQNSQIITLSKEKCEIKPNLFIEENEVEASHSAHIGPFEETLLFYLQSRGISLKKAYNLLLKGFLKQKLFFEDKRLEEKIDQYWR